MEQYVKIYQTHAEHDADVESGNEPQVSHCVEENEVEYKKPHDYSNDYLTFVALGTGTFRHSSEANYSLDGGKTWKVLNKMTDSPILNEGDKISWKKIADSGGRFSATTQFNVEGNTMSILYGDDFKNKTDLSEKSLGYLFATNNKIVNAENMVLPAMTLKKQCYNYMFSGCTSLVIPPAVLPANTLSEKCYNYMFLSCSSLIKTPKLPATELASYCYDSMFYKCSSLKEVSELPALSVPLGAYETMFGLCTSLTTAPDLPATTLVGNSYHYKDMFLGCSSLVNAPNIAYTGLPQYESFAYMFTRCTSLEIAPVLKMLDIGSGGGGLSEMFSGCSKLRYIKALFLNTPKGLYGNVYNWVKGVSSTGVFVKNRNATWDVTATSSNNYAGVPQGWTIEYADE